MGWALPENPNPPDTVCIQARVPNDPAYIDAFWGAILDLGAGFKWADDSAHTAILASRRMRQMYYEMVENNCIPPPNLIQSPCSDCCEGCMPVRWNGCTLEEYDCSTQAWIPVPSINQPCIPNPAPGGGTTPPGPGDCQSYGLAFEADALTVLPFLVNSGDTIQVLDSKGAGTDGSPSWFCLDGSFFIAGACVGGGHVITGDPLVGANHMSCVVKVGSAYYPLVSGTLTLPSGIVNQQIYIGVNDATLSDNNGQYTISLKFCNNQAPPTSSWCHNSDFLVSPDFWTAPGFNEMGGTCETGVLPSGLWSSGDGWQGENYHQSDCTDLVVLDYIAIDLLVPTPLTHITINFNLETAPHPFDNWEIFGSSTLDQSGDVGLAAGSNPGIGPKTESWVGTVTYRYVKVLLNKLQGAGSSPTATITSVEIQGNGTNPFASSNC